MIYLLIKNGVVVNRIEAEESFLSHIKSDYDFILEDQPSVDIGYIYDGFTFSVPTSKPLTNEELVVGKRNAINFGANLMAEFAVMMDNMNLTTEDKLVLLNTIAPVQVLMLSGDIPAAVEILGSLEPSMLLPESVISLFSQKIMEYLNSGR